MRVNQSTFLTVLTIAHKALTRGENIQDAVQILELHMNNCRASVERERKLASKVPPHQSHSETSTAAAVSEIPKFTGKRLAVLRELSRYDMTDEEGQYYTGFTGNTYRPCRVTLMDAGYVYDTGKREMTKARKYAVVWGITDAGRRFLKGGGDEGLQA